MHINIYFHNNIYINYIYKITLKYNVLKKIPIWSDPHDGTVVGLVTL